MNSLKVTVIFLELKCVEKFSGEHFTTFGGAISFAPPVGVTILAQEDKRINNEELIMKNNPFIIFIVKEKIS